MGVEIIDVAGKVDVGHGDLQRLVVGQRGRVNKPINRGLFVASTQKCSILADIDGYPQGLQLIGDQTFSQVRSYHGVAGITGDLYQGSNANATQSREVNIHTAQYITCG